MPSIEKTNIVRQNHFPPARLDDTDRKLLAALSEDGTRSYAELGEIVHLSAPAVHERVKRLKRDEVITGTVAKIRGCKVGRMLLTFVLVDAHNIASTHKLVALADLPEVEEIHTVAGDSCVMIKVRTKDTEALEVFLGRIQTIDGVKGTRSYIVLSTFVERGPSPQQPDAQAFA